MKLRLRQLGKTFRSLRGPINALRDIDLTVDHGELFVLLGPSGCGKSTVLNLVAGLEKPSTGDVLFDDQVMASADTKTFLPPRDRDVAMVFQSYALYPHLSVRENIGFPLHIQGLGKEEIQEAVTQTARTLDIENLLEARPAELSGGQRQRVAIARAIIRKPKIFLLDEPLSNLDANLRTSTRAELKLLQRKLKITTLYVTHDQTEAMTLADRMAVLKDGRLMQIGSPKEIYDRPASPFVASFVGSPPMNLIQCGYRFTDDQPMLVFDSDTLPLSREQSRTAREKEENGLIFGIRPEDVAIARDDHTSRFSGQLMTREDLGRETLLHIDFHGQTVLALITEDMELPRQGEQISFSFDMGRAHFFSRNQER